ncbi:lytic transglycosylase domain-containing protein [Aerophototrophica crusticola]|uniref:Lytic transglycosylase domain-containing protein n=1 Tax=Aerophototrophica crusticola TaxID=1709002 RepID=A0A858R6I3_9PROT|nr:lytic transglycosylase domain-containing protein [Rhodospirillaceae bacterium B3]
MTSALTTAQLTTLKAGSRTAPVQVVDAVKQASASTGVDFSYLLEKASVESGFKTDAKARTSSATGLFQFIDNTWLATVKEHGAKHGLGAYAEMIESGPNGKLTVSDPKARKEILELRKDPRVSALMASELAKDNKEFLEERLGRPVGKAELYMAHFLGAGGAAKFLKAMEKNPNASAASVVPDAARANMSVFYEGARPRSLGQVFDRMAAKFDGEEPRFADSTSFGTVQAADTSSQPWQYGRSVATALEPISTFTVMMLNALTPPTGDEKDKQQPAAAGGKDGQAEERAAPNLAPAVVQA